MIVPFRFGLEAKLAKIERKFSNIMKRKSADLASDGSAKEKHAVNCLSRQNHNNVHNREVSSLLITYTSKLNNLRIYRKISSFRHLHPEQ